MPGDLALALIEKDRIFLQGSAEPGDPAAEPGVSPGKCSRRRKPALRDLGIAMPFVPSSDALVPNSEPCYY